MQDSYWLPPRKAARCRVLGALFLIAALVMAPVIAFAGLTPGAKPYCGGGDGCVWKAEPTMLLAQEVRVLVIASPEAQARFETYVARPEIRLGLAGVEAVSKLPFAVLLFSVGLALRRLGGRGAGTLPQVLRWLRRASIAAIFWALTDPLYQSLLESLLSGGTPTGPVWQTSIYLAQMAAPLLLAIAAYAAVWAIEAGLQAQRDLDSFV
ncbi:hypothetical protein ACG3SL_14635 [Sphingomonas sp. CJ20]